MERWKMTTDFSKSKKMRALFFLAALVMSGVPAYAQEESLAPAQAAEPEQSPKPFDIAILGHVYRLAPLQIEQPSLSWDEVKAYLPADLASASAKPTTDDEVLAVISARRGAAQQEYERMLDALTPQFQKEHPEEPNADAAQIDLAAYFLQGFGDPISPQAQKAAYEYQALYYLERMLTQKLHPASVPETAPAPAP
jgi:hypothetical protein